MKEGGSVLSQGTAASPPSAQVYRLFLARSGGGVGCVGQATAGLACKNGDDFGKKKAIRASEINKMDSLCLGMKAR